MTTNAPADLMAFHHAVMTECGFTDPNEVGIVGDPAHAARGGYHISGDAIRNAGNFNSDYSTSRGRDHFLPNPNASAVDIGDDWPRGGRAAWLRFNNAVVAQLRAADPAVAAIRAINFSPDGTARKRFDSANWASGVINSSDTVTIHTHLEWWRDTVGGAARARSLARLLELIRAARDNTTGDPDMDTTQAKQLADVHFALTSGAFGPEQVRWATGMAKLDAILTKLGVAQADIDDIQARTSPIDVGALAAALAPLLGDNVDEATVVAALESPAGQAALIGAATQGVKDL